MREDHFLFVDLTSVLVINTHADGYDVKMKGKSLSTGCFIQIWVFIELYFAKFDTKSYFMNEDLKKGDLTRYSFYNQSYIFQLVYVIHNK